VVSGLKGRNSKAQGNAAQPRNPGYLVRRNPRSLKGSNNRRLRARGLAVVSPSIPHIPLIDLNAVFLANPPKFLLKSLLSMMVLLIGNVFTQLVDMPRADRKGPISTLPIEIARDVCWALIHAEESLFTSRIKSLGAMFFDIRQRMWT
jgi:hypothetical protein